MLACRTAFWAVLLFLLQAVAVVAQDVTLTSRDGSVTISGDLVGYDGEFYRVDSTYGVLTVDGSGVVCSGPACPDLTAYIAEIRIFGEAQITQRLMPVLIEAFAERQGYSAMRRVTDDGNFTYAMIETASGRESSRFIVRTKTSDEAFAGLVAEEADMALSLREVAANEVMAGLEAGIGRLDAGNQSRVLALDAIVPVVAPENPVTGVSLADLSKILTAELTNWQDLGGVEAPIFLQLPDPGSALATVVAQRLAGNAVPVVQESQGHHLLADLVDIVAKDPFSLGITTLSELGGTRPLPLVDKCGYISTAIADAVKADDYPLTAPLFLYVPQRRLPAVGRDFLRFTRSPAAQFAIRRAGFVDQALTETPIENQGNRLSNAIRAAGPGDLDVLQDMIMALDGFNRLSISFRFDGGSAIYDGQSRSNVGLLAQAIEAGLYDGRTLIFVGFSDGEGAAEANRKLSMMRANAVRDDLIKQAATADLSRTRLDVLGYGASMPMACDDTDSGRGINRRVEVWVR